MRSARQRWQALRSTVGLLGLSLSFQATGAGAIDFEADSFCPAAGRPAVTAPGGDSTPGDEATADPAVDLLTEAARAIATAAEDTDACLEAFADGQKRFDRTLRKERRRMAREGDGETDASPEIVAVQRDITRLWREDQALRRSWIALQTDDRAGAEWWASRLATAAVVRIDAEAAAFLRKLLDAWDWIDIPRFGGAASNRAWLLAQHADDQPELQREVLARMEPWLDKGGVKTANYAYLFDRVAVNAGEPQRYGTQPIWECREDGTLELQPLENPESVDERRAALGLGPVAQDLASMAAGFCGAN